MEDAIIPVVLFLSVAAIIIAYVYWNHKSRQAVMQAVEKSIESGNALTPELLAKLSSPTSSRFRDFRRGIVIAMLGVAGLLATIFIDDTDLISAFRALSMFPLLVGTGFLIVWKLSPNQE
jgi:hypothetical protein